MTADDAKRSARTKKENRRVKDAPKGSGVPLGDIKSVAESISKYKDEELRELHLILFRTPGKSGKRKRSIRFFNGFEEGQFDDDTHIDKLSKNKEIKSVCNQLGLSSNGTKVELATRLHEFLKAPNGEIATTAPKDAKSKSNKQKKSEKSSKSKKKEKSQRTPRPRTGYIQYCSENRDRLNKANPELKMTQISALLANEWKALSEDEKASYTKKAKEEFEESHGDVVALSKKRKSEESSEPKNKTRKRKAKVDDINGKDEESSGKDENNDANGTNGNDASSMGKDDAANEEELGEHGDGDAASMEEMAEKERSDDAQHIEANKEEESDKKKAE